MAKKKSCLGGCSLILLGLVVIGLAVWGFFAIKSAILPQIASVPMLSAGQTSLEIDGRNFGAQKGTVWLSVMGGTERTQMDVIDWSENQIHVKVPANTPSGQVVVQPSSGIGSLASQAHEFITAKQAGRVPTLPGAIWPTFRRDGRNTGRSPLVGTYTGKAPWIFQTGKGLFTTPIIDLQGNIYIGSADHFFYALNPDGALKWKYETGEIIDSAGALVDAAPNSQQAPLVFISGDGNMYGFKLDDGIQNAADRLIWKYEAALRPGISFNRWFEGNVGVGPDGTLYAGNTNFNYYAITPEGKLKWTYATGSNNWSLAAFGNDGTIYWGSNDTFIRAVSPSGKELWTTRTLGFIAASAAVGTDNTVYIGSFDSNLYALDPATGAVRWKFPTLDHIYSSVALGEDARGKTNAIYFGSADGSFYALRPDGSLIWRYDTGDPIRSSPVIGLVTGSDGKSVAEVVYFGSGNGKLYALNAADGSLRWAYDTTPTNPELQDRNDLNGSPALGTEGIYIGGEHGQLVFVPYDYCLKSSDTRCSTTNSDLPGRLGASAAGVEKVGLFYVTPGGNTLPEFPHELGVSTLITLRLVDVKDGLLQNAFVCNNPIGCPASDLVVKLTPAMDVQVDHSADGRYVYIRPQGSGFFAPGTDYTLSVKGRTYSGGMRLGNMTLLGTPHGTFENTFTFKTAASSAAQPALQVTGQQTSALEWTRLAAPLPPMLPSLNQIGFDYMDWILGTVVITPPDSQKHGKVILWAVGAKRGADGKLVVDPASDFTLPLTGSYQNDALLLADQNFKMAITGIDIPFNRFELRGQLGKDGVMQPGASAFADTEALSIPGFGPYLVLAGLANNVYQKLLVAGTYITRGYPADGSANRAPAGVKVDLVTFHAADAQNDGAVTAVFQLAPGTVYATKDHRPGILLVDTDKNEAVFLDYHGLLSSHADKDGNLSSVSLRLPAKTQLPARVKAYVILDVFPIAEKDLGK